MLMNISQYWSQCCKAGAIEILSTCLQKSTRAVNIYYRPMLNIVKSASITIIITVSCTVTFRPRSTSVAGTVSNAEGFACCCRAANDEDGFRVGAGQGFELTAVAVGHLGRNATWR